MIQYPEKKENLWEGFTVQDINVREVLPQADKECLKRLEEMDMNNKWTKHLFSLEKYKDEVFKQGWHNPISVSKINESDLEICTSKLAVTPETKYIISCGYNRNYWHLVWGLKTIKGIIFNSWPEAQEVRSLMEADKKKDQLGLERIYGNLHIPDEKMRRYDLWNTRIPQRLLPRFQINPSRIVERIKGERAKLTGKVPILRPMPGLRSTTTKFFQVSGEPPRSDEPFTFSLQPEGWIFPEDFDKYLKLFKEWK